MLGVEFLKNERGWAVTRKAGRQDEEESMNTQSLFAELWATRGISTTAQRWWEIRSIQEGQGGCRNSGDDARDQRYVEKVDEIPRQREIEDDNPSEIEAVLENIETLRTLSTYMWI